MYQFNDLHGDESNEPTREWNRKLTKDHFKSRTYPSKTSPVVSAIMGGINHHSIGNGDVEVQSLDFPV